MRRAVVVLLVLMGMLWQSFAAAGQGTLMSSGEDLAHSVLHWQETGHHHDEDGTYHQDNSDESSQHLALDSALGAPALWSAPQMKLAEVVETPPTVHDDRTVPGHIPERLRRPPRLNL